MEEFDLDNITPEMVLENMKKNGEIDEESYTEVKFQFEDIEDVGVLNDYQIFEKAYKNNRSGIIIVAQTVIPQLSTLFS